MKSTMKSAFAFIAVALMIMVAVVPMVSVFTEENDVDAAAEPGVVYADGMKAQYYKYDKYTKSFNADVGDLVYRSTSLPATLDPAEWVRDISSPAGAVWYNVNENSKEYGKVLRFSMTDLSDEEIFAILSDTTGKFAEAGASWAVADYGFIQVTWTQFATANMNVDVYRGSNLVGDNLLFGSYSLERAGTYFKGGVESVGIAIFGAAVGGVIDIAGVPHGSYAVVLKSEGVVVDSVPLTIADQIAIASGTVTNANTSSNAIEGAKITYSITEKDGKVSSGTTTTLTSKEAAKLNTFYKTSSVFEAGKYYIMTVPGAVVKITDVSATGYTFATKTYTTNTIVIASGSEEEILVNETIPAFKAKEYCVTIDVESAAGSYKIANASISATIYLQKANATTPSKYDIATSMTGATVVQPTYVSNITDEKGFAYVTYVAPTFATGVTDISAYLYVKVNSASNFTFINNKFAPGTSVDTPSVGEAEKYVPIASSVSTISLKSVESVASLTVSSNGNNLTGVTANATWYYEKLNTAGKIDVLTTSVPEGYTSAGVAKVLGASDENGKINVAYLDPAGSVTGYTHRLFISANNVSPFTFDVISINSAVGAESISTQATGHNGCKVIDNGSAIASATIMPKETAFAISGTIAAPAGVVELVTITANGSSVTKSIDVETNGTTAVSYKIVVIKGDSPKISITCDGYEFSKNEFTIGTVSADVSLAQINMVEVPVEPVKYITETEMGAAFKTLTVDVSGNIAKDVTYTYEIGDKSYKTTVMSTGATTNVATLKVALFSNDIKSPVASIEGFAVSSFSATTNSANAYGLTKVKIVVFNDATDGPKLSNVVEGAKIVAYFKGVEYTTFTSGADGLVTAKICDQFKYKYNGLNISIGDAAVTNPWGADKQFNINGLSYVPEVKKLSISINYLAASSLKNIADATMLNENVDNVVIYNGESKTFVAPELDGFKFAGWVYNGTVTEDKSITISVKDLDSDGAAKLSAIYSAISESEPEEKIDSTTLIIGIAAVVIALIAVIYAVIQKKQ